MSNVRVTSCRAGDIFDDPASAELFAEYAEECANPLNGQTSPDREMYEQLEASGAGVCFAGYVRGTLRGVAFLVVSPVPHYGRAMAMVESVFVRRNSRRAGLGWELMRVMEDCARTRGCESILYSAPACSAFADVLYASPSYVNTNLVFTKRLQ